MDNSFVDQLFVKFEYMCHEHGLKVTHQRLEIFRELLNNPDHPTADMVFQRIKGRFPAMSRDTVFRTLSTLSECGIIRKIDTLESVTRYDIPYENHHHLICTKCGEIMDFVWSDIERVNLPPETSSWGRVEQTNVVVHGVCSNCLISSPIPENSNKLTLTKKNSCKKVNFSI